MSVLDYNKVISQKSASKKRKIQEQTSCEHAEEKQVKKKRSKQTARLLYKQQYACHIFEAKQNRSEHKQRFSECERRILRERESERAA